MTEPSIIPLQRSPAAGSLGTVVVAGKSRERLLGPGLEFLWWAPFCLFPIIAPSFLELIRNDKNMWQKLLSTGRERLQGYSDFPQLAALWRGQGTPGDLKTFQNFTGPGSSVTSSSSEEIKDKRCYITSPRSQSKIEAGWDCTVRTRLRLQRWTGCRWGFQTPSRPLPARWANHSKGPSLSADNSHHLEGLTVLWGSVSPGYLPHCGQVEVESTVFRLQKEFCFDT